jgi:hypothetical protein
MPIGVLDSAIFADMFGADRLRQLTDPANYLGAAPAMVDRMLAGR